MPVTLTCLPQSLCSWNYRVTGLPEADAMIEFDFFCEQGRIDFRVPQQHTLDIVKPTMLVGHWLLKHGDTVLAEAQKLSMFGRTIEIGDGSDLYVLSPQSLLGRTFFLKKNDSEVGRIAPHHPFTRRAECRFNDEVPTNLMVFVLWLTALQWRRQQNKSS